MDERQQQLIAAAEAMRTWMHRQQAMWNEGYPQSLSRAQPQYAAAGVAAVALPAPMVMAEAESAAEPWSDVERGPSWSQGFAERMGSAVQGMTGFVRTSWRMLAGIAVLVLIVWMARLAWPGVKEKASTLASSKQADKIKSEPAARAATPDRSNGGVTRNVVGGKGLGRLQVESSPTGAHVLIDGKDRGVTPLTVEALSIGSHKVVVSAADGSVQRTVSVAAGETVQLSESIYSGWLHVTAPFEIQISEGRKSIRLDDSNQVLISPGPHDVRFENRALGLREVRHLEIRPGETTAISLETPMSHLTVTSSEPATVAIDGAAVGETPLTEFAVPVGTRDVTVTSASGQVRHQTMTMKVQSAEIAVDFSKP